MAGDAKSAQEDEQLTELTNAMREAAHHLPVDAHAEPKVAAYMAGQPQIRYVCLAINNPKGPCDATVAKGTNAGMQIGCTQDLPDMLCENQILDVYWRPNNAGTLEHVSFHGNLTGTHKFHTNHGPQHVKVDVKVNCG